MRMLLRVTFPHAKFNAAVKDGSAGPKIQRILAEQKPESAYFAEFCGKRTGLIIVNMKDSSEIPAYAEPWFLSFDADVEMHPAMNGEDLGKGDLAALGKKWG